MPAFPRCIKCVTTSTVDDIETLDVKCTAPCGRDKFYISNHSYLSVFKTICRKNVQVFTQEGIDTVVSHASSFFYGNIDILVKD